MNIINSSNIEIALAKNIGEYSSLSSIGDAIFRTIGNRKLFIQNGSNTNIPAICIDISNNIGIGTIEPLQKIDIRGIITSDSYTFTNNFSSSISTINTDNVIISTANTERFRIDENGNIGIGKTPNYNLDISGNIRSSKQFYGTSDTSNTPSYSWYNDTITGIFHPSQNTLGFSTNGIERIKIDPIGNIDFNTMYIDSSNNNIGIGTLSPNSEYKLHVKGNTRIEGNLIVNGATTIVDTNVETTEQLVITNDGTGPALIVNQIGSETIIDIQSSNNSVIKINKDGYAGFGVIEPNAIIDISGSNTTNILQLYQSGTGKIINSNSTNFYVSNTGTVVANLFSGSGSSLNNLNSTNINDGTLLVNYGGTGSQSLSINSVLVGNGTSAITQPNNLIWKNNKLGVGISEPNYNLHINGSGYFDTNNGIISIDNNDNSRLGFLKLNNNIPIIASVNNSDIIFGIANNTKLSLSTSYSEIMRISNNKNIGIGVTIPQTQLDISGNINISNFLYKNGIKMGAFDAIRRSFKSTTNQIVYDISVNNLITINTKNVEVYYNGNKLVYINSSNYDYLTTTIYNTTNNYTIIRTTINNTTIPITSSDIIDIIVWPDDINPANTISYQNYIASYSPINQSINIGTVGPSIILYTGYTDINVNDNFSLNKEPGNEASSMMFDDSTNFLFSDNSGENATWNYARLIFRGTTIDGTTGTIARTQIKTCITTTTWTNIGNTFDIVTNDPSGSKGYKTISSPWFSRAQVKNIIGLCFTTICNSSNINDNNSKFRLGQVLIQFKS
jgi:hypothetical protein